MKPIFILTICLTTVLHAQYTPTFDYAQFESNGVVLPYRILKPVDFDPSQKYPLHLFLHGSGEKGTDNELQLTHGSQLFIEQSKNHPAIVIFPQCPTDDSWSPATWNGNTSGRMYTFYEDRPPTKALSKVIQLMDRLAEEPYVDTSRIYVSGLSNGGMGTFEILRHRPELFAAATPICGGAHPRSVLKWAQHTPTWIFHGEDDTIVPAIYSKTMVEALIQNGIEPRFTLYPGVGHNSWENVFAEADFLPWIYRQHKTPKEAGNQWEFLKYNERALLGRYRTENEALPPPKPDENRIVFMGNSITEGWKDTHPEFWQEHPQYINRGYGGHTSFQMLLRFRADVIALKPKAVVILAGTNDIAGNTGVTSIDTVAQMIYSMAELAQQHDIKVVLASVLPTSDYIWRQGLEPAHKIIALNALIKAYAKENGHTYLDYHTTMKNSQGGLQASYTYDGTHCTKEGYLVMETLVQQAIQNVLK